MIHEDSRQEDHTGAITMTDSHHTVTWTKADTSKHPVKGEQPPVTQTSTAHLQEPQAGRLMQPGPSSANHGHIGREGDQVGLGWVHHFQAAFQVHHSDLLHHQGALSILPSFRIQVGIRKPMAGISLCP